MKGIVSFLEKAGLVKMDEPVEPLAPEPDGAAGVDFSLGPTSADAVLTAGDEVGNNIPLNFDDIYANAGVSASAYPAERLLRLVDGLSAMDSATRLMAIKAMDAADESWTIDDPLVDAAAKVQALTRHAERLQLNLQKVEQETQGRLNAVAARQEKVVGDIRKQMAELDALVAREVARAAQETAEHEASLKDTRDQTARELAQLAQASQRLQGLSAQFGATTTAQE
jgi:hypothetical protein